MKLLAVAEHFPSPYKPYHYTQFEQFLSDGHSLDIYAFGRHDGGTGAAGEPGEFVHRTHYLPGTLRDIPGLLGGLAWQVCTQPLRTIRRAARGFGFKVSMKERLMNLVRAALLPSAAPDVCLVHNLRAATHLRFLKAIYPEAVVTMYYHGGELPGVPVPPPEVVRNTFENFDLVFTNTHSSGRRVVERGQVPERIVVSPVGFDLRFFPDPHDRGYRQNGRFNLLMAGRLSEEKGFLLGLKALKVLFDEGVRDVLMRIAGDGPQRSMLVDFVAEHGLGEHVEFLGRVDQRQLVRLYAETDALILPSIPAGTCDENQACVVQEAMLARAVAAVSRIGGVCESTAPELLPYSFEPGSVVSMVSSLRSLMQLSVAELSELGARGRAFAESRYDIRRLNRELLEAALSCRRSPATDAAAVTA